MTTLRNLTLSAATALALTGTQAVAAGAEVHIDDVDFSFDGLFGAYDQMQLQRGLQIYTEICAACHGLELVAIRTLGDDGGPALPEDQVFAYAGLAQLWYGIGGAEYITALMAGYEEEPECALEGEPMDGYYNVAFEYGGFPESCIDEKGKHKVPGSWISMPQPIYGEDIEFADGHANDVQHMSEDVAAFLMWAAEPKLNARKEAGLTGVIFLAILSVLLYLTNKRIWAPHKGKE